MNNKTYDLATMGLMAAVTAIMAQIAIPMPQGVPMTLQTFAVTLAGIILGSKRGAISMLIYLLLGAVGLPVFSGFRGGLGMLVGPTGGFLISFPIMAFIIGLGVHYAGADSQPRHQFQSGQSSHSGQLSHSKQLSHSGQLSFGTVMFWAFLITGTVFNYIVGTLVFCLSTGSSLEAGITACVVPFVPTTIIKAILAGLLGQRLRKAISEIN